MNLAGMVAEYRIRYPGKVFICDFDSAGWAWVCAGGSLPRLPAATDVSLLGAIPRMRPWAGGDGLERWALREAGVQYLVFVGTRGPTKLDLSEERGIFAVHSVQLQTGEVFPVGKQLAAGQPVDLASFANAGQTVLWLVKE